MEYNLKPFIRKVNTITRVDKEKTRKEIADELNISVGTLNNVMCEQKKINNVKVILDIMEYFKCDLHGVIEVERVGNSE